VKRAITAGLFLGCLGLACTSNRTETRDDASTPPPKTVEAPAPAKVDGAALLARAEAARAAGDGAGARTLFTQATLDPSAKPAAQLALAEIVFMEDGDPGAAEPLLALSLAGTPPSTRALLLAGRIKEAQGQRPHARTHFENAVKQDPLLVDAHERLAALALADLFEAQSAKNVDGVKDAALRALVAFKDARTRAGDKPSYALGEAQALEATGDVAGAESALKRVQAMSPQAPGPHLLLASFYERKGDRTRAAAERKKAGQEAEPPKRKLRPLKPAR